MTVEMKEATYGDTEAVTAVCSTCNETLAEAYLGFGLHALPMQADMSGWVYAAADIHDDKYKGKHKITIYRRKKTGSPPDGA